MTGTAQVARVTRATSHLLARNDLYRAVQSAAPEDLARQNPADTGLTARMTMWQGRAEALTKTGAHDVIFVPSAFIPAHDLPEVLSLTHAALRPDGRLLLAVIEPTDQPEEAALAGFRAAVWGGDALGVSQGSALLAAAGFDHVEAMQQPGGFIAFLLAVP